MRNEEVVRVFIHGFGHARGSNLYIEGDKLINYTTIIALRYSDSIVMNENHYSRTTKVHQNRIEDFADNLIRVNERIINALSRGDLTLEEAQEKMEEIRGDE